MMLNFFDTPSDVFTAFVVFAGSIPFILKVSRVIGTPQKRAMLLYFWHLIFIWAFTQFTLGGGVDSATYYQKSHDLDLSFSLGTGAVPYFGALPAGIIGLSYFGINLLFGTFAFIGLLLMDRMILEAAADKSRYLQFSAGLFAFLPSLHFWTASLSKDGIMFLGMGMVCWAAQVLNARWLLFFIGVLLVILVRPHMAVIMLGALCVGISFDKRAQLLTKTVLLTLGMAVLLAILPTVLEKFGLGSASSLGEIENYIDSRQNISVGGSSIDLSSMSLPMQIFSFAFRPFLIEANSIMSLLAGVDNLFLSISFLIAGKAAFTGRYKDPNLGGRLFLLIYGVMGWLILAQVTYNLGLASRQKWMVIPVVFLVLVSYAKPRKRNLTGITTYNLNARSSV